MTFALAGGGTGGHVIPLLAVARELARRGHQCVFIGTQTGLEAKLVPASGFPLESIRIGGLKGLGWGRRLQTAWQLPVSAGRALRLLRRWRASAVFSMGGYVAGPTVIAALLAGIPVLAMEPNARPGLTNIRLGRYVARTLIAFPEAAAYFPAGKTELTGLPVREEFLAIPPKPPDGVLEILITGGSRGSRTLNRAARESWPLFLRSGLAVRLIQQTGREECEAMREAFAATGLAGQVRAFIDDMPKAYASADLVVSRAGAGAVAELAAAGRPAILVPFPYAADDHQRHNAEALARAGAARMILDDQMTGERLWEEVSRLATQPGRLAEMGAAGRRLARPGAAARAAFLLEELARPAESR